MATINIHMKFEIEIPKQTWLMLRKPCRLQTDGRTDRRTDGQTDKVNPVYPPSNFVGRGYNNTVQKTARMWSIEYVPSVMYIYPKCVRMDLVNINTVDFKCYSWNYKSTFCIWVSKNAFSFISFGYTVDQVLESYKMMKAVISYLLLILCLIVHHGGRGHKATTPVDMHICCHWDLMHTIGWWPSLKTYQHHKIIIGSVVLNITIKIIKIQVNVHAS